jgi:hypothetical protein
MLPKEDSGTSDETHIPPAKCGGDCSCSEMSDEVEQSRKIITQQGNEIARLRVERDEAMGEASRQHNLAVQFEVERDKLQEVLEAIDAADSESDAASSENKEDEEYSYATETDVDGEIALFGVDLPKAQEQAVTLAELYGTPIAVYRIRLVKVGEARRVTQFVAA